MKKIAVCILCMMFVAGIIACSKPLTYTGKVLEDGIVGVQYEESIAKTTDREDISYALKAGSNLPAGLTINQEGVISGIPTETVTSHEFVATATAKSSSVDATFTITIKEGSLNLKDGELLVEIDKPYRHSLAIKDINAKFSIKSGELPTGLELSEDGVISGEATNLGEAKTIVIEVSAPGYKTAQVNYSMKVVLPLINYEGTILSTGRVGEAYDTSVRTAKGAPEAKITYSLKEGSILPNGLTLNIYGIISGVPLETAASLEFVVIASADGFTTAEATFKISVQSSNANPNPPEGLITYPTGKTLSKVGNLGEYYYAPKGASAETDPTKASTIAIATSNNRQIISYSIEIGNLPQGLYLLASGTIYGVPEAIGSFTFSIKATAPGCNPVIAQFTIVIEGTRLEMDLSNVVMDLGTVGDVYDFSLAKAKTPDNSEAEITYTLTPGYFLPSGLTLTADGRITGTPEESTWGRFVGVKASAEGYASISSECLIVIQDKIQEPEKVSGGYKLEAEYIYLNDLEGGGKSGAPSGRGLIQNDISNASGGFYVGFTYLAGFQLEYKFNLSKAVSGATLTLALDSEIGALAVNSDVLRITINGVVCQYNPVTVMGAMQDGSPYGLSEFKEYTFNIAGGMNLREGENTISFTVLENKIVEGYAHLDAAPVFDYMILGGLGDSKLTWRPEIRNLEI